MPKSRASLPQVLISGIIALNELVVLIFRPDNWQFAAIKLALLFLVIHTETQGSAVDPRLQRDHLGALVVRFIRRRARVRRMMTTLAFAAVIFWPLQYARFEAHLEALASNHALMAYLFSNEAALMKQKESACQGRARSGAQWDEAGEEIESLKACPYPNDCPEHASWSEQAKVWERAASRTQSAADWHARMCDFHCGRSPIEPLHP